MGLGTYPLLFKWITLIFLIIFLVLWMIISLQIIWSSGVRSRELFLVKRCKSTYLLLSQLLLANAHEFGGILFFLQYRFCVGIFSLIVFLWMNYLWKKAFCWLRDVIFVNKGVNLWIIFLLNVLMLKLFGSSLLLNFNAILMLSALLSLFFFLSFGERVQFAYSKSLMCGYFFRFNVIWFTHN